MSFNNIMRIIKRPSEKYILEKKITYQKKTNSQVLKDEVGNIIRKDAVGNISEKWKTVIELEGVIQHRQDEEIDNGGEESALNYYGYFKPTFDLLTDRLSEYRVKFIRNYETLYLKIIQYDPNNFYRKNRHHITLVMKEDKKYQGRQE